MSRCDLDLWLPDLELLQHFGWHVFKLCTESERNWTMRSWVIDLTIFFKGGRGFTNSPRRGRTTKFGENRNPSSLHQASYFGIDELLRFEMRVAQERMVPKIEGKCHTFWPPPVKIGEGGWECWEGWMSRHYGQSCHIHLTGGYCAV